MSDKLHETQIIAAEEMNLEWSQEGLNLRYSNLYLHIYFSDFHIFITKPQPKIKNIVFQHGLENIS